MAESFRHPSFSKVLLACAAVWIATSTGAAFCSPAADLTKEGIQLYRAKDYAKSVEKFESALAIAEPGTTDMLDAATNVLYPIIDLGDQDAIWKAKRRLHLLRYTYLHEPVPAEFDGDTPELAKENTLKKAARRAEAEEDEIAAKSALLKYYEEKHRYEDGAKVLSELVTEAKGDISLLSAFHGEWARFAAAEGRLQDANVHRKQADELKARVDQARKLKLASDAARLKQQALQNEIARKKRDAEQAIAQKLKSEAEMEVAKFDSQPLTREDLPAPGRRFVCSQLGGYLDFRGGGDVEIQSEYSRYNGIDLSLLSGRYSVGKNASGWEVRIYYTWGGAEQIATYRAIRSQGKVVLMSRSNCKPLPDFCRR